MAGYDWYKSFLRRHNNLSQRKAQNLNPARTQKLNPAIAQDHFNKLESVLDKLDIKQSPERIFNIDEKGCRLTLHHNQSVLAAKGSRRVHLICNEHAENCTVVACVSALGYAIPPMIIFKGLRLKESYKNNLPHGSTVEMAIKGSMTREIFVRWLQHFSKFKPAGRVLLILDGASCHLDISVVDTAEEYEISLYCLPSNTTHEFQPLDKAVFRAFEHYWDVELLRYWEKYSTASKTLKKDNFGKILDPVWKQCMSISNIQSGFKSTGIFPFDPSVIPEVAFAPSMLTFRSLDETIEQKNGNDSSGDELPLSVLAKKIKRTSSRPGCSHSTENAPLEIQPPISVKKDTLDEKANDTKTSLSKKETESVAREHDTTSKSPKIKVLDITVIKPPPDEANCNTNKFRQLLPTPDFVIRRQVTPRRKAINYKAQLLKRDLFSERSSPKPTKTKQKLTNSEHASQNCRKGSDISDWMCSICAEERVEDMRRCAVCHSWVHEDCVGLTADDVEEFVCPNCSP
ncbi:hypothetical protein MML48_3g00013778 [Holotrichia oblita]|uniref:Uncharacterized protein n=1 Tax=Holotrichia oblita TaxID=644536 RepID=A0ACB9TIA1_HOLOL|nr:hypothetical protein MML48_3g00013778 [Holotrichia oblita]